MKPEFNEACADAVGYCRHTYTLMTKNGKFQWRWNYPPPPETFTLDVSPVFDTQLEAIEWAEKRNTGLITFERTGWEPVKP